jgi:hypothetical protein
MLGQIRRCSRQRSWLIRILPRDDDTKVRVYEMYRDAAAFDVHLNGPSLAQKKRRRNGVEASWGAVRGRGLAAVTKSRQSDDCRRTAVNTPAYNKDVTALLVVDPYNDFISEGGKIWPRIKAVAEANNCVGHMLEVLDASRRAKLRVFYAMHHRYRPGDYETWKYIAPIQKVAWQHRTFEFGTWGGEFRTEFMPAPGEIVAQEHWCSSGFANTDLDLQLKKYGIHRLIVWADSAYLRRSDRPLRRRARLRSHRSQGRDGGLLGRDDARRARHQHPQLCPCRRDHGTDRGFDPST